MAGAALGADGKPGGDGAEADQFSAASVGAVKVAGAIDGSTVTAGLDPARVVAAAGSASAAGSTIRSVTARAADAGCQFIAGRIGSLKLPKKVDLTSDSRVKLMP